MRHPGRRRVDRAVQAATVEATREKKAFLERDGFFWRAGSVRSSVSFSRASFLSSEAVSLVRLFACGRFAFFVVSIREALILYHQ